MTLDPSDVRRWAKATKIPTSDRGRLPRSTTALYLKAHPSLARELATTLGIDVSSRGPVSAWACEQVADLL